MDAGNPIRPDYPLESARQVRGRTYGNVVYACDEGKVYRGPPPQLPPPVSNAPETPYASRITATLGLSPPLSPSPFAIYPRIVAAECVNKRRAQTRDAARNFRSGGRNRNPIEPRPLASVVPLRSMDKLITRGLRGV